MSFFYSCVFYFWLSYDFEIYFTIKLISIILSSSFPFYTKLAQKIKRLYCFLRIGDGIAIKLTDPILCILAHLFQLQQYSTHTPISLNTRRCLKQLHFFKRVNQRFSLSEESH